MNEGEGILVSHGRPARRSASHGLAWLALVVALPGLISGVSLFLYYLSNFGIDSLFNALQGRWLDIAWFVGLALSGCSCILGGVLVVLARRRGERVLPALWAFWLGAAGLLVPMVGILALIVAFLFWPGS
jgi:hypothetical protein